MLTPGSLELKIEMSLRDLGMSTRNCIGVSSLFPHTSKISRSTLTDALAGKTRLNQQLAESLIELLEELETVQAMFGVSPYPLPWDWSQSERIADLVLVARLKKFESELHFRSNYDEHIR